MAATFSATGVFGEVRRVATGLIEGWKTDWASSSPYRLSSSPDPSAGGLEVGLAVLGPAFESDNDDGLGGEGGLVAALGRP